MRKSKFSESQRRAIVKEQAEGKSIEAICRDHQISPSTLNKWRVESSTLEVESKRRLQELEVENKRLKKMYSELSLDHSILKEGYDLLKKWQAQDAKKK
jgi:putative transposase